MIRYTLNKGFIVQKLDDKTVIFDGEKSTLYTFNETASYIFQKIKKGISKERIIELIIKKYKIKKEKAEKDFNEFLQELLQKKIISGKN